MFELEIEKRKTQINRKPTRPKLSNPSPTRFLLGATHSLPARPSPACSRASSLLGRSTRVPPFPLGPTFSRTAHARGPHPARPSALPATSTRALAPSPLAPRTHTSAPSSAASASARSRWQSWPTCQHPTPRVTCLFPSSSARPLARDPRRDPHPRAQRHGRPDPARLLYIAPRGPLRLIPIAAAAPNPSSHRPPCSAARSSCAAVLTPLRCTTATTNPRLSPTSTPRSSPSPCSRLPGPAAREFHLHRSTVSSLRRHDSSPLARLRPH